MNLVSAPSKALPELGGTFVSTVISSQLYCRSLVLLR